MHASLNAEGNSAMGRNKRMGYFPAAGIAWNLQNEPFLKAARDRWLDEAKIRISVGQSGRAPSGTSVYLGAYIKGDNYMNMAGLNACNWMTYIGKLLLNITMVQMLCYLADV